MPRGLGRGLGALIPTGPARDPVATPVVDGATARTTAGPPPQDAVDRWLLGGAPDALARRSDGPPVEGGTSGTATGDDLVDPTVGASTGAAPDGAGTPDAEPVSDAGTFRAIPVDLISPNPRQPRSEFDVDALAELVASIREVGLLQPVVVRPVPGGRFELVMGERRWRASREAGLATVPAVVRETDDRDLLRDALLENLHRTDLNPLEEAAAYQQLLDDTACSQEELSRRIGRSRPQISNTLRLLRLPVTVQRRVAAGVLSAGHARSLVALEEPAAQEALATRVVAEGLSVRATEEIVASGSADTAPRRRPRASAPAASDEFDEVAQRLGDHLETRVTVGSGRGRGRIVVEFATTDDLRRIATLMVGPGQV